jgi:predicted kinase
MIIEPDQFYYENGVYHWSPERATAAWEKSYALLEQALLAGMIRRVVLLIGLPGSGKSTWSQTADAADTVVFDGFFGYPERRARVLQIARRFGIPVEVVWVTTDLETCIAHNATRPEDRRVPEETIRTMAKQLERCPPVPEEGYARFERIPAK